MKNNWARQRSNKISTIICGICCVPICFYGAYILVNRAINPHDCETNFPMRNGEYFQCIQAREALKDNVEHKKV